MYCYTFLYSYTNVYGTNVPVVAMKKRLKVLLKVLGIIVVLVGVLLVYLFQRPAVMRSYNQKVSTGGETESKYMQNGSYAVNYLEADAMQSFKKYEIWYPSVVGETDETYPVVIFANGTGVKGSKYRAVMEHLASWGFIVMATEEEYSWNGFSVEMCIRYAIKMNEGTASEEQEWQTFVNRVDLEHIGVCGHSQGGVGALNAMTVMEHAQWITAGYIESPTSMELAEALEWSYDAALVTQPVMLCAGTGKTDSEMIIPLDSLKDIYDAVNSNVKIMARRNDADHGDMLSYTDGYMTAFFVWQLKGDESLRDILTSELQDNALYQDVQVQIKKS